MCIYKFVYVYQKCLTVGALTEVFIGFFLYWEIRATYIGDR